MGVVKTLYFTVFEDLSEELGRSPTESEIKERIDSIINPNNCKCPHKVERLEDLCDSCREEYESWHDNQVFD